MTELPQVGVLTTYFGLFDAGMPAGFRSERLSDVSSVHVLVEQVAVCHHAPLLDSAEAGVRAAEQLRGNRLDALVIVPTMATPPEWAVSVARSLPGIPVLVLAVRNLDAVPHDYDTEQATRNSLLVGVSMLTNALLREQLPYELIIATRGDADLADRVSSFLQAAQVVGAVRQTRLLAVGDPIPGYSDVEARPEDLAMLGVSMHAATAADVAGWVAATTPAAVAEVVARSRELGSVEVGEDVLARAAGVACALRGAVSEIGATAGSVNCHGPLVRQNPDVGITACLAVSLLAQEGVMFSCTGDLPAAVALVIGRAVAGSALYCELYAVDQPGDWILVANGGEGDTANAVPGSVRLLPEEHYAGIHGAGVAVAFKLRASAATLLSLTPLSSAHGGWRLVLGEGEVLGSRHPTMEGPNAMLSIDGVPALDAYAAWCEAGASHHSVLLPGRHARTLARAAQMLGAEVVVVSRAGR